MQASNDHLDGLQNVEKWEGIRNRIRTGDLEVWINILDSTISATYIVEATIHPSPVPAGVLWFRESDLPHTIYISECYVPVYLRRCGIMDKMFDAMIAHFLDTPERVITGRFTELSLPWGLKKGFVFDKELDNWVLNLSKGALNERTHGTSQEAGSDS